MTSRLRMQWEAVGDRQRHLLRVISRKTQRLKAEKVDLDILVLNDQSLFFDSDTIPLVRGLSAMRRNRVLELSDRTTLLVHSETNCMRFR